MKLKLHAGVIVAISLLAAVPAHSVPLPITITFDKDDKGASACAIALEETKAVLSDLVDIEVKLQPQESDRHHRSNGKKIEGFNLEVLKYPGSHLMLVQTPFVFRDAEHFQQFLGSDLYRQYIDLSRREEIAIAYGGFYQIFSYEAAVTEPKHFYNRFIGGIAHAVWVYSEFGSMVALGMGMMGADTVAADAKRMAEGDRRINMVESLLISAIENGLDRNSRYVNLTSSLVGVIYFQGGAGYSKLNRQTKRRVRAWADAASAKCSEHNYKLEVETLERLKAAGLTVVPFNRTAMFEVSLKKVLHEHHEWTISDLDRLVKLGTSDKSLAVPSSLLAKLTPLQRQSALKIENENAQSKSARLKSYQEELLSNRQSDNNLSQANDFAKRLAKLGPPKKFSSPNHSRSDVSKLDAERLKKLSSLLIESIKLCSDCKPDPRPWAVAAEGLFLSGDTNLSVGAMDQAFALSQSIANAKVIQVAARIGDRRALSSALKFAESVTEIPKLLEPRDVHVWQMLRLKELCIAAILLGYVGEDARARLAIDEALKLAELIDKTQANNAAQMLFFLAAAQFQSGDTKEAWLLLQRAVRNEFHPFSFPVVQVGDISIPEIETHIVKSRIDQLEKSAEVLKQLSDQSRQVEGYLIYFVERSATTCLMYRLRDCADRNFGKIKASEKIVRKENKERYRQALDDLSRKFAIWRDESFLTASKLTGQGRIDTFQDMLEMSMLRLEE